MPVSTQCTKPFGTGASGSTTSRASSVAPDGTPVQESSGDTLEPWHVNFAGIGPLSANADEVRVNVPADAVVPGPVRAVVPGPGDAAVSLDEPPQPSAAAARNRASASTAPEWRGRDLVMVCTLLVVVCAPDGDDRVVNPPAHDRPDPYARRNISRNSGRERSLCDEPATPPPRTERRPAGRRCDGRGARRGLGAR